MSRAHTPHIAVGSRLALRLAAAIGLTLALALAVAPVAPAPARAQDGAHDLYAPDLRSAGPTTASLPAALAEPVRRRFGPRRAAAPGSISDFGYSAIDLANLGSGALSLKLELSQRGRNARSFTRQLPGGGALTFRLADESTVSDGVWHAAVRAPGATGAVVRSGWVLSGTSTSAYEGLRPATKQLVPLFVRGVNGLYSDYTVMNVDTTRETNAVTFQAFAPDSGELLAEWEERLAPGDVISLDAIEFGTAVSDLVANRPGDGWVGGLRIESPAPVAVLVYQNEANEGGVAALGARPFSAAATTQHLPLVRGNFLGSSAIAVQNRESRKAEVTITFRGAPDSPKHRGQTVTQSFSIGPYGMHVVDLGRGGDLGDVAPTTVDRGSGTNTGFHGSAVVTSDQPVVAAVLETSGQPDRTRTSAAYNAFTAADLGQHFVVPAVRSRAGERVTRLYVQAPGAAAQVTVQVIAPGGRVTSLESSVPAGEMRVVALGDDANGGRALVQSDQPVAVLVYETPFGAVGDWVDADVFDTVAYAAPRTSGALPTTPPTASPTSGPGSPSPTAGTPPVGASPTATRAATPTPDRTGPRWEITLPIVLRSVRIR